jgi:hypothetical protein
MLWRVQPLGDCTLWLQALCKFQFDVTIGKSTGGGFEPTHIFAITNRAVFPVVLWILIYLNELFRLGMIFREQIDDWGERSSEKSVLYREWIRGAKGHSKAIELFGSLQVSAESRPID